MTENSAEEADVRPASRRLADLLLAQIEDGDYEVGQPLPPYRQLAAEHDVAVNTAIAAVRILRDVGAVTIRPNSGARVRDRADDVDTASELRAIRQDLVDARTRAARALADLGNLEARLAKVVDRLPTEG